jgi:transporter family protein
METWVWYALFSMLFAGFTSVLAKVGSSQVHPNVSLMVRTTTIFVLVIGFALATRNVRSLGQVPANHL